ncbi:MAG: ABC-F family ATP-binding cassette domain-containing protein [Pseudomonadota bacterium]
MLTLQHATLSVGGRDLLVDVDWQVHPGERVGLVGPNGSGKTSLLRVLLGELDLERGSLWLRPGIAVGYLRQQPPSRGEVRLWDAARASMTRHDALQRELDLAQAAVERGAEGAVERLGEATERFRLAGGYAAEERVGEVLWGLGFRREDWEKPCSTFSGGWQVRIELCCLLLSEPALLLLDEPTNHLDLAARTWLAGFLERYPWALVVVTHDRHLLARACNRVAEIHGTRLLRFRGGLDVWLQERELLLDREREAFEVQQDERRRLQDFVDKHRARATSAAAARSRQKVLDRMELVEAPRRERRPHLRLPEPTPCFGTPIALTGATLGWPDAPPVFTGLDLALEPGMRLALLGPNGCGKSTLLKALAGRLPLSAGRRRIAEGVRVGVFTQEAARDLPEDVSALDHTIATLPLATPEQARATLGALGLSGEAALRPIGSLSGGERARVVLAGLALRRHDVLLLDEPTNHLDAVTVGVLTEALAGFAGTVVLASHDRYLVEGAATAVARVGGGRFELRQGVRPDDFEAGALRGPAEGTTEPSSGARSHAEQKRVARERERLQRRLEAVHAGIEQVEAAMIEGEAAMVAAATDHVALRALDEAQRGLRARCDALYQEWEQLEAALAAQA